MKFLRPNTAKSLSELLADLYGPLVVDVLVDGRVGLQVGVVQREVAELEQLEFAGQLQHIDKALAESLEVLAAELTDPIVIRVSARCQVADRHVTVGGSFDLSGGK